MAKFKFDLDNIASKINLVREYNYYMPKKKGTLEEADDSDEEDPSMEDTSMEDNVDPAKEDQGDDDSMGGDSEGEDISADELGLGDLESASGGESMDDMSGMEDMGDMDSGMEDIGADEVELDITDLVDKMENNSQEISQVNQRVDDIGSKMDSKFAEFTEKIVQVSNQMVNNINSLQKNIGAELKKRNPTPNEQLQMQSLRSYPYDQKLTDFWKPVDKFDAQSEMDNAYGNNQSFDLKIGNKNVKKDEDDYVITQSDIDSPMSDLFIRDSF